MGRLYSKEKGIATNVLPYRRHSLDWKGLSETNVKLINLISKFSEKGLSPSQIGLILRDSFSIIDVKNITGFNILKILKLKGIKIEIPEDLFHLMKKFKMINTHLKYHFKDKASKYKLRHIESHISRLSHYYKTKRLLPKNWKFKNFIIGKNYL